MDVLPADAHEVDLPHQFVGQPDLEVRILQLIQAPERGPACRADERVEGSDRAKQMDDGFLVVRPFILGELGCVVDARGRCKNLGYEKMS